MRQSAIRKYEKKSAQNNNASDFFLFVKTVRLPDDWATI